MKETKAHDIRTRFGRNVAAERARRDLSQQELSDEAGIARNYLSRIERGASSPTVHVAVWLADALGVTTSHLTEERMSTDYILQKIDELKDAIRDEQEARSGLEARVRTLEKMLESDTWAGEVSDIAGRMIGVRDELDALAQHLGVKFTGDYETEVVQLDEARDGTDG